MLLHDALAVRRIHVAHLDTTRAVAALTTWATHKELAGRLGLEQALAT